MVPKLGARRPPKPLTPEALEGEWRKRHRRSRRTSKFTRLRIWLILCVGTLSTIYAILHNLQSMTNGVPANAGTLTFVAAFYDFLLGSANAILIVAVIVAVRRYIHVRTNLDVNTEQFHPLRAEATEEIDRFLIPLCQRMGVERSKILPLCPKNSLSFSPSVVEKRNGQVLLVVPADFLTLLLERPEVAEAMLAHELGHVVQQDTNLWLYASAFAEQLMRFFLPFDLFQAAAIVAIAILFRGSLAILSGYAGTSASDQPQSIPTALLIVFFSFLPVISLLLFYSQIKRFRRSSEELADLAAWLFTQPPGHGLTAAFHFVEQRKGVGNAQTSEDAIAPFGFSGELFLRRRFFNIHPSVTNRLKNLEHYNALISGTVRRLHLTSYSAYGDLAYVILPLILAVLAAVLFPVFSNVREKARTLSCASNQKQLGIAISQYMQDSDEVMPGSLDDRGKNVPEPNPAANVTTWTAAVYPFVKSTSVFQCPDASRQRYSDPSNSGDMADAKKVDTNYLYNGIVAMKPYSAFHNPEVTIAMHERDQVRDPVQEPHLLPNDPTRAVHFNHASYDSLHHPESSIVSSGKQGANIAFMDGHVAFFRKGDIPYEWFGAPQTKNPGLSPQLEVSANDADAAYKVTRIVGLGGFTKNKLSLARP